MNLSQLRLRYGLFWFAKYPNPFTDYAVYTWASLLALITVTAITNIASLAHTLHATEAAYAHTRLLNNSYLKVVVQAMNGEARFQVGSEIFQCRGGSLGSSTVTKITSGVAYIK